MPKEYLTTCILCYSGGVVGWVIFCFLFCLLSVVSAAALQVHFTLGRPQKANAYFSPGLLSWMWEMPANLSSSCSTVTDFKVFMTKVCVCVLCFPLKCAPVLYRKK